ncbi:MULTISPECIES: AraC family transcriptional regulator [Rhodopseudomonas]|uniref:AraC family transcriptional regulator n=1 Tax=Rhodopseudomonas palustris TaxID=1076 RepID=A0A0D7EFP6_RHOPL|nr:MULTISPECIES: AraC family transcriptional regulator [Rhodopseudomonas]KIZ39471.1 AraC family transcriptional regulator [Rhodopseudomonas palustris]MDF3814073.1 AraC family transcriptional regulator [Rhodopseudomonas sp. BAL398]WOK19690.1 AraC family transcriptional regulator [Rhodopseudomonas sp. BAL398]
MNDDECPDCGHLMLISPERVFYAGLLGRPRQRSCGGYSVYASLEGKLRISVEGGPSRACAMAFVPPYRAHSVESDCRSVVCLMIEPETVDPAAMTALGARIGGAGEGVLAGRIRRAYLALLASGRRNGFTTAEFDTLFFGEALPVRSIDRRIARTIVRLNDFSGSAATADDCAGMVNLSQSRFLHLFKDETGISFRALRAWKRARHLLHFVNEDINLAHLAQDIGYPDSSHFSHSIRRFYGLQPRAIFSGSRDLAIYRSDPAAGVSADLRQGRQ